MTAPVLHELEHARGLLLERASERKGSFRASAEELADLAAQGGYWLAQDRLRAPRDWPEADLSRMDGFALRAADLAGSGGGARLRLAGTSYAETPTKALAERLAPGAAWRIQTGAPLPVGADCVAPQEDCELDANGEEVQVRGRPAAGDWVRSEGSEARKGQPLAEGSTPLTPRLAALAAGMRMEGVRLWRRPRVAVFSLGAELARRGDANGPLLAATLGRMGLQVAPPKILEDDLQAVCEGLQRAARECDLILTSGGASVGERDYLRAAVERVGSLDLVRLNLKPGMPLALGRVGGALLAGLPGNPLAVAVLWGLLVAPTLRAWSGDPQPLPAPRTMVLDREVRNPGRRPWVMLGNLANGRVRLDRGQHSGALPLLGGCDCAVRVEAGASPKAGGEVPGWLFSDWGI